jgi:hypothetical protein
MRKIRKIIYVRGKKGEAGEWSVSHFATYILIAILLALIIYGIISGQLQQLVKKVGIIMDSILSMVGIRKTTPIDNSKAVIVPDIGKGALTFDLDKMECELKLDNGERYRLNSEGKIESYEKLVYFSGTLTWLRYFKGQWFFSRANNWEWRMIEYSKDNFLVLLFDRVIIDNVLASYLKDELKDKNMKESEPFLISHGGEIKELWFGGEFIEPYESKGVQYLVEIKDFLQEKCA